MNGGRETAAGTGYDGPDTGPLRARFPFDAPPRSTLRRYRLALMVALVLVLAGGLVFAYLRVRTHATYTSRGGGFTLEYERRFADIGFTGKGSTSAGHIAEAAFRDEDADAGDGDDPNITGLRITVEAVSDAPLRRSLEDLAAAWRRQQAGATPANETVEVPYEVAVAAAGECLRTVVTRRYETRLWRAATYVFLRGDRLYRLTFSAHADEWDETWSHLATSLDSFRITYDGAPAGGGT